MPTTSSFRIESGVVSDSSICRVYVEPDLESAAYLCIDSGKYRIRVALVGSQLEIVKRDLEAAQAKGAEANRDSVALWAAERARIQAAS